MAEEKNRVIAEALKRLQELEGLALCEVMCEAVLRAPEVYHAQFSEPELNEVDRSNPVLVLVREEGYLPSASARYDDLARIVLAYVAALKTWADNVDMGTRMLDGSPQPSANDFISLQRFMQLNIDFQPFGKLPSWLFRESDIEQITWYYFHGSEGALDQAMSRLCACVQQGVPLFRSNSEGQYVALPFNDGNYVYIAKKAEHDETHVAAREQAGRFPPWTQGLYFNWSHLQIRETYFGGWRSYHTSEATAILRTAFRRQIGFEVDASGRDSDPPAIDRRLLEVARQALAQYHRDGSFGPNHAKGSIEKNVKSWLRETFGIRSNRQLDGSIVLKHRAIALALHSVGTPRVDALAVNPVIYRTRIVPFDRLIG
jgi:hypothetical protein